MLNNFTEIMPFVDYLMQVYHTQSPVTLSKTEMDKIQSQKDKKLISSKKQPSSDGLN